MENRSWNGGYGGACKREISPSPLIIVGCHLRARAKKQSILTSNKQPFTNTRKFRLCPCSFPFLQYYCCTNCGMNPTTVVISRCLPITSTWTPAGQMLCTAFLPRMRINLGSMMCHSRQMTNTPKEVENSGHFLNMQKCVI